MKLLYYLPTSYGGLADYAHEQANALVKAGVKVYVLTTPNYLTGRGEHYHVLPILQELKPDQPLANKILKGIRYVNVILSNIKALVRIIQHHQFQYVLLGSYAEFIAPLWSGSLRQLAQQGTIFGAVVHDPIRDFVLGPVWWHRWSIAAAYSFLREAFVHEAIALDTVRPMPQLRTTVIPHGPYSFDPPQATREQIRQRLNLPGSAQVMLAFGHIRDNKNLDLVLQAMVQFPDLYLVVAGQSVSASQRSPDFYQNLALQLGVSDRCRWEVRFIADEEIGNFFVASDLVLLTYRQSFQSASGVFNIAVHYRRLCLASGGEGPLRSAVQTYQLGIWVEPDRVDTIVRGIQVWMEQPSQGLWERYLADHSWDMNAQLVLKQFTEVQGQSG